MNDTKKPAAPQYYPLPFFVRVQVAQVIGCFLISITFSKLLSSGFWSAFNLLYPPNHAPVNVYFPRHIGVFDWATYVPFFIVGSLILSVTFIVYALNKKQYTHQRDLMRGAAASTRRGTPRSIFFARRIGYFILLPQLFVLLYLLSFSIAGAIINKPSYGRSAHFALQMTLYEYGPAFVIGVLFLFRAKFGSAYYSLRSGSLHAEDTATNRSPSSEFKMRVAGVIGALLLLPSLASATVLCYFGQFGGSNYKRPAAGLVAALLGTIHQMGPANLLGCGLLVWSSTSCMRYLAHGSYNRCRNMQNSRLLLASKLLAVFGAIFMTPAFAILAISAWFALSQLFDYSFYAQGLSGNIIVVYGRWVVLGSLLLLSASITWYIALCLHPIKNNEETAQTNSPTIPRLSKVGFAVGCLLLSPTLVQIVVVIWNYFGNLIMYADPRALFNATQILQREFAIFAPVTYAAYIILIASAAGAIVVHFINKRSTKPAPQVAQSFDDM